MRRVDRGRDIRYLDPGYGEPPVDSRGNPLPHPLESAVLNNLFRSKRGETPPVVPVYEDYRNAVDDDYMAKYISYIENNNALFHIKEFSKDEYAWETREGEKYKIDEISDRHLLNIIDYLIRRQGSLVGSLFDLMSQRIRSFQFEASKRGLLAKRKVVPPYLPKTKIKDLFLIDVE